MEEQGVHLDAQTQPAPRLGWPAQPYGADSANRISLRFEAGPSAAAWARNALAAVDPHVEPHLMADVRLLVSELVTNSVRHSAMLPTDVVGLDVVVDSEMIHVQVCDSGTGFQPRARQPGQSKAGGWGLYLVERIADRWGVRSNDVTRVWFEIDCVAGARAAG
jgi:anti-sigma regulatory factor (Ser/Thr protein kinase)